MPPDNRCEYLVIFNRPFSITQRIVALVNLDIDILRSFVTGTELGSFAKAADLLGRSPSAISLQLRKLEEQVGQSLLRKQGRGLALTEAGEVLLGYAQRILELNDEADIALRGLKALEGWVRIGVPQDFAETWLPGLLARFERAHPKVRIEARVERGSVLTTAVENGKLDFALTWRQSGNNGGEVVAARKLAWIGTESWRPDPQGVLPLVAFDTPCAFREAAITALDGAGIAWRQAFMSPGLAGIWAAVTAGLGVTLRTAAGKPAHLHILQSADTGLPPPGTLDLVLHRRKGSVPQSVIALQRLVIEAVAREQND